MDRKPGMVFSHRFFADAYRFDQTWGIQEIGGERRYTRHLKFTGPQGEDIEAVLVYDYRESRSRT